MTGGYVNVSKKKARDCREGETSEQVSLSPGERKGLREKKVQARQNSEKEEGKRASTTIRIRGKRWEAETDINRGRKEGC